MVSICEVGTSRFVLHCTTTRGPKRLAVPQFASSVPPAAQPASVAHSPPEGHGCADSRVRLRGCRFWDEPSALAENDGSPRT